VANLDTVPDGRGVPSVNPHVNTRVIAKSGPTRIGVRRYLGAWLPLLEAM